ncbi:MAG: HAD-IIIC family phosphatase [Verrucomicrobiota bacterium]
MSSSAIPARKTPGPLTRAEFVQQAAAIQATPDPALTPIKVAILSTFTVDLMKPCLIVEGAAQGFLLDLWLGPFGQIEQQVFDPGSLFYQADPQSVLLLARLEDWAPEVACRFVSLPAEALAEAKTRLISRFQQVLEQIRQKTQATVLVANFPALPWLAAGLADPSLPTSQTSFIQQLNEALAEVCARLPGTAILDAARVAAEVGLRHWSDERMTYLAKAPLSLDAMASLSAAFARRLRSLAVTPKKCLVLDLDNTLWGEVLGEAGLDGIALGPDYPGNVFVDFHKRVLALRDCGVLLAVASKNNAQDAIQALDQHPASLLRSEHFSAFEAHWEDKATSLRRIARSLNIGTDALVFFDDNPTEREWVRSQLPEVTVIEVPASPLGYAKALAECRCFDFAGLVQEDLQRAGLYQKESQRQEMQAQTASLEDFLAGLEMKITAGPADEAVLPRIVQLLGKTNQFNLTTRRHSAADLQALLDAGSQILWFRVQDKFGDNGVVGVLIASPIGTGGGWYLDSFLMSCRVIGRQVETAMLAILEKLLASQGATTLTADFFPTAKNQPAVNFLADHGFESNGSQWILSLAKPRPLPDCLQPEGPFTQL